MLIGNDKRYRGFAHSILLHENMPRGSSLVSFSHFYHLGISKPVVRMLFSPCFTGTSTHSTPFLSHIIRVILICTQEKVIRTYTGRCIAMMANKKASRNWPKVKLIRELVGRCALFLAKTNTTIIGCRPEPASVSLCDVAPKTLFRRLFIGIRACS